MKRDRHHPFQRTGQYVECQLEGGKGRRGDDRLSGTTAASKCYGYCWNCGRFEATQRIANARKELHQHHPDRSRVAPVPPPVLGKPERRWSINKPVCLRSKTARYNFSLDGVGNNEPLFNGIPMFPPPEAINEMKVESGMTSGASGHASGANVNLVTKSGTNEYHGDVWESLRNNALDAEAFSCRNWAASD